VSLFPLLVLTWYQSYRLTPVFYSVPIIFLFLVHSSFCILNHNQNQNTHKYPSCAKFFFSSIFSSFARAISLHTPTWVTLFVKMTCRTVIVSSTSKYHHLILSCWKKKCSKRFHAHNWLNSSYSSCFRSKSSMSMSWP
jgi:hypothetical protein